MAEEIIFLLNSEEERKRLGLNAYDESLRFTQASHTKMREDVYEKAMTGLQNPAAQRYRYDC